MHDTKGRNDMFSCYVEFILHKLSYNIEQSHHKSYKYNLMSTHCFPFCRLSTALKSLNKSSTKMQTFWCYFLDIPMTSVCFSSLDVRILLWKASRLEKRTSRVVVEKLCLYKTESRVEDEVWGGNNVRRWRIKRKLLVQQKCSKHTPNKIHNNKTTTFFSHHSITEM
jgi:hypothetical protein